MFLTPWDHHRGALTRPHDLCQRLSTLAGNPAVVGLEKRAAATKLIMPPTTKFPATPRPRGRTLCHYWPFVSSTLLAALLGLLVLPWSLAAAPSITALTASGTLAWTNALVPGVTTVETQDRLNGRWSPLPNVYSTNAAGQSAVNLRATNQFFRLASVDISATAAGFTNLINAYGLLQTVAGNGTGRVDAVSYWQNSFEGGPATNAALSRPHYAMADRAGNIYIVDKDSHSVLRVATNGTINTLAGTHAGGFNGEGPAPATNLQLNFPNALWVRSDGTVYVLDTDNARVRRITTNGLMSTLFKAQSDTTTPLDGGRCLWVRDDEGLAYFGNKTRVRKWTPTGGLQTLASGYTELGTFCVKANGDLLVADRGGDYVYNVTAGGTATIIAGNGTTNGGGDRASALATGFYGPRGLWPVPTGGYLLLLHDGAQLWYVDAANLVHLLLNGLGGNVFVHAGDGQYFYAPTRYFIGEGRSVTMDYAGNIIICESDYGFIRRILFQRLSP